MIDHKFSIYQQSKFKGKIVPLSSIVVEVKKKNLTLIEENLLSLSYGKIVRKSINSEGGLLPNSFDGYNIIEQGDIVLRLTDLQNDKRSLRTGLALEKGIITSAYTTIRPTNVDSKWLAYTLHSYDIQKIFYSLGSGMRQSMIFSDLKNLPIYLPPIEEQRRIADYLDSELNKVNQLISMKKQTIALNLEGFYSARHELVTGRNLSPQIDADIGWLDTVPKIWKKAPLRSMVSFQKGKDPARLNLEYCAINPGDFPVYSGQTENDGLFATINTFDFDISGDALLIRTVGTLNLVGTTTLISGKVSLSQNCALILPRSKDINMIYLHYVLPSLLEIKKAGIPSDMQASLRFADLSQFWLHWPSIDDQCRIAAEISTLEQYVKNMNDLIGKSVSSLEEYRNSLITQSITGYLGIPSGKSVA